MRFTVAFVATTGAVGLLASAAVLLPQTSAQAAAPSLTASPSNPVVNERVVFSGRLQTRLQRPIRLQRWDGSKWVLVKSGTVRSTGSFSLAATTRKGKTKYRALAPRSSGLGQVITSSRTITAAVPAGRLTVTPAPVGQAKTGTPADLTPFTAAFTPVRAGRPVTLQRLDAGVWKSLSTSTQNKKGAATFQVARPAPTSKYRAVTASFNGAAAVPTAARTPTQWVRKFNDDFGGTALSSKWSPRMVGIRSGKRMCAESSVDSVSVGNGTLRLEAKQIAGPSTDCPYGQYKNGHIGTGGTFGFKHGILAARIKFPAQPGQHGAFWSQPVSGPGSEIDVIEHFGAGTKLGGIAHNIYWGAATAASRDYSYPNLNALLLPPKQNWASGFHTFSVEWTPTQYIFRVDGYETFRTGKGVSQNPQYLILSLLTSDWELDDFNYANRGAMYVDWVRVWQAA